MIQSALTWVQGQITLEMITSRKRTGSLTTAALSRTRVSWRLRGDVFAGFSTSELSRSGGRRLALVPVPAPSPATLPGGGKECCRSCDDPDGHNFTAGDGSARLIARAAPWV